MLYGFVDQGLYAGVISGIDRDGGSSVAERGNFLGYGVNSRGLRVGVWWDEGGRRGVRDGFGSDDDWILLASSCSVRVNIDAGW